MAYPYGSPDQHAGQPTAAYGGWYPPQFTGTANQRTSPGNQPLWAVLVLGLATYVVSCAAVRQPGGLEWGVRLSTLASVVAAMGLLPRQSAFAKLVAPLAVMGFLETLSAWISASGAQETGWATIVIVVLTALQAVTAIAALVAQLRMRGAAEHSLASHDPYAAYSYYAQAAQQYNTANAQPLQQVQGQATANAEAAAAAQAQQSAAERYSLYEEYVNAPPARPSPPASSPRTPGRTQTAQPASGTGIPTSGPTESIQLGNDPAAGSAGRSFSS